VRALPRGVRWRARNGMTTGRWLWLRASGQIASAYADDFWDYHSGGDWPGFANLLLRYCRPRSVVDVGCGDGKLLAAVRACDPGLKVLGIDSSSAALDRAAAAGVPVLPHDLASLRGRDLTSLRACLSGFDVAVSLETAEHLPSWAGRAFVASLAHTRMVVFSAAQPYQGGTLHLNERPPSYWRARFEAQGFRAAAFEQALRDDLARLDLHWCYAANLQVFERA
jgi:SAM-dependent methyltransferase